MVKSERWIRRGVVLAAAGLALACSSQGESNEVETGSVELALSAVPDDVSCIAISAAAAVGTSVELYDVSPGQEFSTVMDGLPFGEVQFSGEAFDSPCDGVDAASVGTWASQVEVETIVPGVVSVVTLVMRRNGKVCIEVTFDDNFTSDVEGLSEDVCSLPVEVGPCDAAIPRFYFNPETGICERFVYGGCGGNENNFATLQQCNDACSIQEGGCVSSVCELPAGVAGPCRAVIERWTFNEESGSCEPFIYGGCGGNANNFESQEECESSCLAASPCSELDCNPGQTCEIFEPTGEAFCADTCDALECPDGQECRLVDVLCVREPCPPIAQCVGVADEP